jgi:hypothetical protein
MGCCVKFMAIFKRNGPWWRNHLRNYNLEGNILSCGGLPPSMSVPIYSPTQQYRRNDGGEDGPIDDGRIIDTVPLFPYCFDLSPVSSILVSPSSSTFTTTTTISSSINDDDHDKEATPYGVLCCFIEGMAYHHFNTFTEEEQKDLLIEYLRLSFESVFKDVDGDDKSITTTTTATAAADHIYDEGDDWISDKKYDQRKLQQHDLHHPTQE